VNQLIATISLTGFWALFYQVIVVFSLVGSLVFPVWYGSTGLWAHSDMGGHLFAYSIWSAVTMLLASIKPLFGDGPVQTSIAGMILVFSLGVLGWWRAWLFYKHHDPSKGKP